jgi:hypothetical protein
MPEAPQVVEKEEFADKSRRITILPRHKPPNALKPLRLRTE